jgi:Flp pilus assembly protein TadD
MRDAARWTRLLGSAAVAAALGLSVAGCMTTGNSDITGSIGGGGSSSNASANANTPAPRSDAEWRRSLDVWGDRYKEDPGNIEAAMNYAKALRATGQRAQAVAVLEQASMRNPKDMPLLGAYGRALADAGDYEQALKVLDRAHTPDNPDWRILNAQGAVLDQLGRHDEAQRHYSSALKIVPGEPSVLSNLGLSYALTKDLKRAESTLRLAVNAPNAAPKVRQNLALVVGLQGRFAEAEKIAASDLPPDQAAANIDYLRVMLAQQSEAAKDTRKPGKKQLPLPDSGT